MLRLVVVAIGGACVAGGAIAILMSGGGGGWGALVLGALLLIGTIFERVHYKPVEPGRPGPGWEPTNERFFDEESGKPVRVYIHRETGERRYIED